MRTILERINSVAGVTGSLVCGAEGQALASAFPAPFDEEALSVVGRTTAQTVIGLQKARRTKIRQMDVTYEAGRFIVQNLQTGYLCILCGPHTNIPLLNLTVAGTTSRLLEMIGQKATEPAVRMAGAADPLDTVSRLIEMLVAEMGDRGVGREQLLTILARRLERLQAARPLLGAIAIDGGRVDLVALRSRPNAEMAEAVALVVRAICYTCIGMLGREATRARYHQVYEPFYRQNEGLLRTLGLDRILDKADTLEGGPLPGIDFKL